MHALDERIDPAQVQDLAGPIADDPLVEVRGDLKEIAGREVDLAAVGQLHLDATGEHHAHVLGRGVSRPRGARSPPRWPLPRSSPPSISPPSARCSPSLAPTAGCCSTSTGSTPWWATYSAWVTVWRPGGCSSGCRAWARPSPS